MKNIVRSGIFSIGLVWLTMLNNITFAIDLDNSKWNTTWDNGTGWDFIGTLDRMLWYLIGLLYFVAVVFCLYGGFTILTAWWDEEKVKKWKTMLINAVIGLIVIFLASQIVRWIIGLWANTMNG